MARLTRKEIDFTLLLLLPPSFAGFPRGKKREDGREGLGLAVYGEASIRMRHVQRDASASARLASPEFGPAPASCFAHRPALRPRPTPSDPRPRDILALSVSERTRLDDTPTTINHASSPRRIPTSPHTATSRFDFAMDHPGRKIIGQLTGTW